MKSLVAVAVAASSVFSLDSALASSDSFWQKRCEGWFCYKDAPKQPKVEIKKQVQVEQSAPAEEPLPAEVKWLDAFSKKLEQQRKIAIVTAKAEDVRKYLQMEKQLMDMSSRYADVTQLVAMTEQDLDIANADRPLNAAGLSTWSAEKEASDLRKVQELAKDHVIFFYFRSDCPYCHKLAPLLLVLQQNTGMKIVAISTDGEGLPEFPNYKVDNGSADRLGVTKTPTLMLANPGAKQIQYLGVGVMSPADIQRRIAAVTDKGAEEVVANVRKSLE